MHNSTHKADLQFRQLCKSWRGCTKRQKNDAVKIAKSSTRTKRAIVSAVVGTLSAIAFIVFHDSLGVMLMMPISVLGYFYGLAIGDFLFDAIVNIKQ